MAYKIGTLTNSGGLFANQNLLAFIREFAGGFGTIGTIGGTRTGTGALVQLEASPTAVTETWTLTCTAAAANGGTFSVSGSVSGAQAAATVGVAYSISKITFTVADGSTDYIVGDVFTIPVTESTNPVASRWEVLRYDTTLAIRELILKGKGAGTEEIFIGFRSYQDVAADYYNISVAGFGGYTPGNSFITQYKYVESGIPTHNLSIGYWMIVNSRRVAFALKVGTPVYVAGYAGKMLQFAPPTQYPYPLVAAGMFTGVPATRYSDTAQSIPFKGNRANFKLLFNDGTWMQPYTWPWTAAYIAGASAQIRETGTVYPPLAIILHNNSNASYGALEGVCHISGFNNVVENTLVINGVTYVVFQDVYRTGFNDYFVMEMS